MAYVALRVLRFRGQGLRVYGLGYRVVEKAENQFENRMEHGMETGFTYVLRACNFRAHFSQNRFWVFSVQDFWLRGVQS